MTPVIKYLIAASIGKNEVTLFLCNAKITYEIKLINFKCYI